MADDPAAPRASDLDAVVVRSHAGVRAVLGDPVRFTAVGALDLGQRRPLVPLQSTPDAHPALRAALDPVFSASAVRRHEIELDRRARALLAGCEGATTVDLNAVVSRKLPYHALSVVLGLDEDLELLAALHDGILGPEAADADRRQVGDRIWGLFEPIVGRRRDPRDDDLDLIAALQRARIAGAPIEEADITATCYLLLLAGIDPVATAFAALFAHLAPLGVARRALLDDAGALRRTTEELLRWSTTVHQLTRVAMVDAEVDGCPVAAGQRIACILPAANRDERAFVEPDRFDPERPAAAHLAFGWGAHRCVGAHLARLELRIGAVAVDDLLPGYLPAPGHPLPSPATISAADPLLVEVGIDRPTTTADGAAS